MKVKELIAELSEGKGGSKPVLVFGDRGEDESFLDDSNPNGDSNSNPNSDPWILANESGIYISRDKDFKAGHVSEGGYVSALFDAYNRECYSFDVVVSKGWRRRGLASVLLDVAIEEYDMLLEPFPEMKFCVEVVSPVMEKMLKRRGFVIDERRGSSVYMSRRS